MVMGVRLLLVDDDPIALQAVSYTLRHFLPAVTVETCMNPISALLRLQNESFAVVLSDFNMPDMNGLALLRAAQEGGADASFILMTGDSTDDMLTDGLRLGLFALVEKPLNRATFIPLVQQAIECHGLRQELTELRGTLREPGVEWGSLMGKLTAGTEKVFQPPLPY
jgi:DNA-binding NtrC family response regulator